MAWERSGNSTPWHLVADRDAHQVDPWNQYACGESRPYPHGNHGAGGRRPPAGDTACTECVALAQPEVADER